MNRNKLVLLLLLFTIFSFTIPQDSPLSIEEITKQLDEYLVNTPQEKVYIHTDKPYYAINETIWFKVYVVNARTHLPFSIGNIIWVDLIKPDDEVAFSIPVKIDRATGHGDFFIDETMTAGTYKIRGYSEYMRNFDPVFIFHKEIKITNPKAFLASTEVAETNSAQLVPTFTASFFPEGGDLIHGLSSRVGFKAVDESGKGIDVTGKVLDEEGNFVVAFKSFKFGLGFFSLKPVPGKSYIAEVVHEGITKTFELPKALTQGYSLQVQQLRENLLTISIESNLQEGLANTMLHGHIRGMTFLGINGPGAEQKYQYNIPTDSLPSGVAHITLFKTSGEPMCERLVFIQNPSQNTQMAVSANSTQFGIRQPIHLDLQLKNQGTSLEEIANVSVSITDNDIVANNPEGLNINSYLLLTSDLKGRIENPGFYFQNQQRSTKLILDLLMMTQGWRRFEWKEVLAGQYPELTHIPEDGFTFSGKVTKLNNTKKPIKSVVTFTTLGSNMVTTEFTTEDDGYFRFAGLQLEDTTKVLIQANEYNERLQKKDPDESGKGSRYVSIVLDPQTYPDYNPQLPPIIQAPDVSYITKYSREKERINTIDSNYRQWTIDLDEITIKAKRKELDDPFVIAKKYYREPDSRIILDSMRSRAASFRNIYDFLRGRVPGVDIRGSYPEQYAIIRGQSSIVLSNEAQILVDGVPVSNSLANQFSLNNVAYVDVIKGARAAIFGADANNGVIAIYTRTGPTGRPDKPVVGMVNFEHPGFYKARTFYAPSYDEKKPEHIKPDFRTTLHWAPQVETDEKGRASISCYANDKPGAYQVNIQGLTASGNPVIGTYTIEIVGN